MAEEPLLPPELERRIFQIAALSHPGMIPPLLRVAHRVFVWIEPLLYRVVRIETNSAEANAFKAALKSKPPSFFQGATRHLALIDTADWTVDEIVHALQVSTELVDLLGIDRAFNPELLPTLGSLHLNFLAGCLGDFFGGKHAINLKHPLFTSVTHLDLFDFIGDADSHLILGVVSMPSLTHLCLNNNIPWSVIDRLLADSESPRLQLLLLCWPVKSVGLEHAKTMPIHDVRLVLWVYTEYLHDWYVGATDGANYWTRAEDFVARKRAGSVDKSFYWLDMDDELQV